MLDYVFGADSFGVMKLLRCSLLIFVFCVRLFAEPKIEWESMSADELKSAVFRAVFAQLYKGEELSADDFFRIEKLAEGNHSFAPVLNLLGDCYYFGKIGGEADFDRAYACYERALEYALADAEAQGRPPNRVAPNALLNLGVCRINGEGCEKDAALGVRYLERAHGLYADDDKSLKYLVACSVAGIGVEKNSDAVKYFCSAPKEGAAMCSHAGMCSQDDYDEYASALKDLESYADVRGGMKKLIKDERVLALCRDDDALNRVLDSIMPYCGARTILNHGKKFYENEKLDEELRRELSLKYYRMAADKDYPRALNALAVIIDRFFGNSENMEEKFALCLRASQLDIKNDLDGMPLRNVGKNYRLGMGVEKDVQKGLECLREAVLLGCGMAAFDLGCLYRDGEGVEKNLKTAFQYFLRAERLSYQKSELPLAYFYWHGRGGVTDYGKAMAYFERILKRDDLYDENTRAMASNSVGYMYEKGEGVLQNLAKAFEFYKKGAEMGYEVSQYNVALMHYRGIAVKKDNAEGLKWYRASAENGYSLAQSQLGYFYSHGVCVEKDKTEGFKWYKLAADGGHQFAQAWIGFAYKDGLGVEKDYGEAVRYFEMLCEKKNGWGHVGMGACYKNGYFFEKDLDKAEGYYKMGLQSGLPEAYCHAGNFYYSAFDGARDADAFRCFKMAADRDIDEGYYHVGICYKNGRGVPKDMAEAERLLKIAADMGHDGAKKLLEKGLE